MFGILDTIRAIPIMSHNLADQFAMFLEADGGDGCYGIYSWVGGILDSSHYAVGFDLNVSP